MADSDPTDRDDALLRRLYDEPDADSADGELAREVESFRRVRGAIADYARASEVEPPARGVDELLAAARQRVPARSAAVMPEAPGLWARLRAWFAPIAAHPALASAAMVVVVAAIGGVLYIKGKGNVAETEVGTSHTAQTGDEVRAQDPAAPMPPPSDPGIVAGLDDGDALEDTNAATAAPANTPVPPPTNGSERGKEVTATKPPPPARPDPRPTKPNTATGTRPTKDAEGQGGGDSEGPGLRGLGKSAGDVSVGPGQVVIDGRNTGGTAPVFESTGNVGATPAPPPPPSTPGGRTEKGEPGVDTADDQLMAGEDAGETETVKAETTKSKVPGSKGADVQQLTRQARTAAKGGDCAVVKAIGGKVKKANAAYYKQTFAADATIKKCL